MLIKMFKKNVPKTGDRNKENTSGTNLQMGAVILWCTNISIYGSSNVQKRNLQTRTVLKITAQVTTVSNIIILLCIIYY